MSSNRQRPVLAGSAPAPPRAAVVRAYRSRLSSCGSTSSVVSRLFDETTDDARRLVAHVRRNTHTRVHHAAAAAAAAAARLRANLGRAFYIHTPHSHGFQLKPSIAVLWV